MLKKKDRLDFIDTIRGFAVVNMVLYHLIYDLVYIFGRDLAWFSNHGAYIWQQFIAWSFILIAGFSFNLSKKPIRNGLKLTGISLIISLVTVIFTPDQAIYFGVIHMLGTVTLIVGFLDRSLGRINEYLGMGISMFLFIMTKNIYNGYLGLGGIEYVLPSYLYDNKFLFWLGFPSKAFRSADYFPILPWIFLFLVGYFLGRLYKEGKLRIPDISIRPLSWVGRRSLFIYVIHQPLIYLILSLIF